MSTHLYKVTAVKAYGKLTTGMTVEVVIRNASRPPSQREVIVRLIRNMVQERL